MSKKRHLFIFWIPPSKDIQFQWFLFPASLRNLTPKKLINFPASLAYCGRTTWRCAKVIFQQCYLWIYSSVVNEAIKQCHNRLSSCICADKKLTSNTCYSTLINVEPCEIRSKITGVLITYRSLVYHLFFWGRLMDPLRSQPTGLTKPRPLLNCYNSSLTDGLWRFTQW